MSDLIKRSDAIKATWQEPTYTDPLNVLTEVRDRIEAIPSADRPQEWIPCSERLPSNFSEDETVLVTTDVDGDRVILMFAFDVKSFYLKGYVSAWMPLPKPYGEREGE